MEALMQAVLQKMDEEAEKNVKNNYEDKNTLHFGGLTTVWFTLSSPTLQLKYLLTLHKFKLFIYTIYVYICWQINLTSKYIYFFK